MKKYIVYNEFLLEKSNVDLTGKFGGYHYHVQDNKLTVIYSKRKVKGESISDHFQLDAAFFGLISTISLAFEVRCSTSRHGRYFENTLEYSRLIKSNEIFNVLLEKLRTLKCLSNLQADHEPIGFNQSPSHIFREEHLELAKNIILDLTEIIDKSPKNGRYFTQVDYWRRGFDLSELHYDAEGFLNYFKIIEHVIKDRSTRQLTDEYIKQELKKLKLASLSKRVCFYRNLRNRFNIGHYIPLIPKLNDYDEYLSNMSAWIWNHESDIAQVTKLLILRGAGCRGYYMEEDGGLYFVKKRQKL